MRAAGVCAVSAESMRAYIRTRRDARGFTAETFAKAIGMPYPTYRDFESGATNELKTSPFLRVVDVLKIPTDHLTSLSKPETSPEEAAKLALRRGPLLRARKDETSLLSLFGSIFSKKDRRLSEEEQEKISEVLGSLSDEQLQIITATIHRINDDPDSVYWFLGFLDGVAQGIVKARTEINALLGESH